MQFNSYDFVLFFPLVLLIYFVVPAKIRYIWLLISSYYFYMGWNPKYAILIAFSTIVTYVCGLILCFLQVLFGQSCKTFLDIVACPNWTKLQSVGQS